MIDIRLSTVWLMPFLLLSIGACAHRPKGEYRAGLFLHSSPDYSFQIPEGWRAARADDYDRFGFNQRLLQKLNDEGRQLLRRQTERDIAAVEALLISNGADCDIWRKSKRELCARYELNQSEKNHLWSELSNAMIGGARANDKPRLTLKSMKVAQYGPNTALVVKFISEVQAGTLHPTAIGFFGRSNTVVMLHVGTPPNLDEGLDAVEAAARTFRFE